MAAPSEPTGDWYQLIFPAVVVTLGSIFAFLTAYFKKAAEPEPTPAGQVAGGAVGAGLIDRSTADLATRTAEDVRTIREIAERWEDREMADERAELAELRRLAKMKDR